MNAVSKTLIPNQEWIIEDHGKKIGSVYKKKKSYYFIRKGKTISFPNLDEVKNKLGISITENSLSKNNINNDNTYSIYDYPCGVKPFNTLYNIKEKLPLFSKSSKSQSLYCAGYYVIKFRKGWVKSFCPKLITLERYPYFGPFKQEQEMKQMLSTLNKA